jgi:ligand-binding SRPBCC domain-containing protein
MYLLSGEEPTRVARQRLKKAPEEIVAICVMHVGQVQVVTSPFGVAATQLLDEMTGEMEMADGDEPVVVPCSETLLVDDQPTLFVGYMIESPVKGWALEGRTTYEYVGLVVWAPTLSFVQLLHAP